MQLHRVIIPVAIVFSVCGGARAADRVKPRWSFSASANTYVVPDDDDYIQPSFTADRERLHLEARYNYEDLDTASFWLGANFSFGEKISFDITPMVGGVFGDTTGVAPGYRGALNWRQFEIYSEGEYLFDTDEPTDSYFYTWSELTLAPCPWLRAGLVIQRNATYEQERNIQRGFLIGVQNKSMQITLNVFNPDLDKPLTVISMGVEF